MGGGEPFLHDKLFDFVDYLKLKNKMVTIYTNGSLLKKRLNQLFDSKLDYLNVSHYDNNFSSIQRELSRIINETNIVVRMSKVVNKNNYKNMEDVIKQIDKINCREIIFQNLYPMSDADNDLVLEDGNKEYMAFCKYLKQKYKKINITFPNLLKINSKFNCRNLSLNITYDCNGNISPCCFIVPPHQKYGNIFDDSNVWNSEEFLKLRQGGNAKKCKKCYFRHGLQNRFR